MLLLALSVGGWYFASSIYVGDHDQNTNVSQRRDDEEAVVGDLGEHEKLLEQLLITYPSVEQLRIVADASSILEITHHFKSKTDKEKNNKEENGKAAVVLAPRELNMRAHYISIATNDTHAQLRSFVGNLHKILKPENKWIRVDPNSADVKNNDAMESKVLITIYGLALNPYFVTEIRSWKNVYYIDAQEFIKSKSLEIDSQGKLTESKQPTTFQVEHWRPFLLKQAVEKYNKILYMDPAVQFQDEESLVRLEQDLEEMGSVFVAKDKETFQLDQCLLGIQGYKLGSLGYKNYLLPQVNCAFRVCTSDEQKLLHPTNAKEILQKLDEKEKRAVMCSTRYSSSFTTSATNDASCYLYPNELGVLSTRQLIAGKYDHVKPVANQIAILIPLRVIDKSESVTSTTLYTDLLAELLKSVSSETSLTFKLYFGYEAYDQYYEWEEVQKILREKIKQLAPKDIPTHFVRVVNGNKELVAIWNALFQQAVDDGAEFLLQLHPDTKSTSTKNWISEMVTMLKDAKRAIIGPSFAMVSHQHLAIFGSLYPSSLKNSFYNEWCTYFVHFRS